ncbi:hypothetical protein [Schlesneria paludicola]|uniref:hypothetical protein n=1 Tax=Schlesneria paludicola TaxID=360056 RepID=UPI00029A028E|nr:hypothetical protein [Schlesneria paludicola]
MTAAVTTLQTGLKAMLEAIPANDRPLQYTVRIADVDVSDLPAKSVDPEIVIGFESSQRLGRTTATILDQYLIPVTIRRRMPKQDQTQLNENHALEEVLLDALANYHSETARVDQLVTLHPFDIASAVSPGLYTSKIVLDCDVLRRVSPIVQDDTTPTTILTKIRRAVWDALENWSEWDETTWTRAFRDDADLDELALHDPAEFEFPAIAVTWGPTSPRHLTNLAQDWPAMINVTAWFPPHQTSLAEYRASQIVRAIWQCKPEGQNVEYVRRACGRFPEKNSPINLDSIELGRSGQVKALKLTCGFVITGISTPYNA